jgi:tellurite resistance-related uncharacterized protein
VNTRSSAADELPDGLELQRRTPTFTEESTPAGLRAAHAVGEHTWGRLVVEVGTIGFVFEDAADDVRTVSAGEHQIIAPERLHHVVLGDPVRFHVEFHRAPLPPT